MSVCVCIASRGRPAELQRTVEETYKSARLMSTQVAVALDDDDPTLADYAPWQRAPRESSLGAKYNRAASYARPDTTVFVLGVDDVYMATKGWDVALLAAAAQFKDGVGVVYSGPKEYTPVQLPHGFAVTKKWIDEVGFFCPPYFPFWWHDTWIDELARMTGRYVWTDIEWKRHGKSETEGHKTTRLREISWWMKFFDATQQMRIEKALQIIDRLEYADWHRSQLKHEIFATGQLLWDRNVLLREYPDQFERRYTEDENQDDPGYLLIKAQAQAMLDQINKQAAE